MRTIKVYKTYRFTRQDPIVDDVRTTVEDEAIARGISTKAMANTACDLSGVSRSTKANWYSGKTHRPQASTLNAFLRAMDHRLGIVKMNEKKR